MVNQLVFVFCQVMRKYENLVTIYMTANGRTFQKLLERKIVKKEKQGGVSY